MPGMQTLIDDNGYENGYDYFLLEKYENIYDDCTTTAPRRSLRTRCEPNLLTFFTDVNRALRDACCTPAGTCICARVLWPEPGRP